MTASTPMMSRPLAATSVANRKPTSPCKTHAEDLTMGVHHRGGGGGVGWGGVGWGGVGWGKGSLGS